MMRFIEIVTVGKSPRKEDFFNYENLKKIEKSSNRRVKLSFVTSNTKALSSVYNTFLKDSVNRNKILVFIHDDAIISDSMFLEKIDSAINEDNYNIFGVAGSSPPFKLTKDGIFLWHLSSERERTHGHIFTFSNNGFGNKNKITDETTLTRFGTCNHRVFLIDGVIICVDMKSCYGKVLFDEECPSKFNFYDLIFSYNANKNGLSVGVINLDISHCSPGLDVVDKDFAVGNSYFIDMLKKDGMLRYIPENPKLGNGELKTEDKIVFNKCGFHLAPLQNTFSFPYIWIPGGLTSSRISYGVNHGMKIGKDDDSIPSWVHIPSDTGGCSWWRMNMIENYANYGKKANVFQINASVDSVSFWDLNFDAIRIQRECFNKELEYYKYIRKLISLRGYKTKLIWEVDDIVIGDIIPSFNRAKELYSNEKISDNIKRIVDLCDHVTVVSDFMKNVYSDYFNGKEIRVLENYSHRGWFDGLYDIDKRMRDFVSNIERPRILVAGAGSHFLVGSTDRNKMGDYRDIIDVVIRTRKKYKWVFMAHMPAELEPFVRNGDIEVLPWANLVEYPVALDKSRCQVMITPLEDNIFNRAKSDIKYKESCMLGRPCILQNIEPYKNAPHRFDNASDIPDMIDSMLKDEDTYRNLCVTYRDASNGMWMEDNWDKIKYAYR